MSEIKEEGDILDIGANIGIMSYHLSKKFPSKKVYGIEPIPSSFEVLSKIKNKFRLNNLELLPFAVGEENKMIEMVLPIESKVKMQGLAHVVHESIEERNHGQFFSVECKKIDTYFENNKIAAIKMDIENFEYFALKGAEKILIQNKPIVYIELWENENRNLCFNFLKELGYQIFINENNNLVAYDSNIKNKQNFIFKMNSTHL